jgi:hypothetical protein
MEEIGDGFLNRFDICPSLAAQVHRHLATKRYMLGALFRL